MHSYESISSVGSSRLVRRYELSSFSVISIFILRQNYELILKRQRKMCTFLFLVRVREDGDVFFDRAHALSWVVLPLRGLGSFIVMV